MQIGRFFRWWGSELSALLPQSMRDASRRRFDTLRFNVSSPAILVSHQAEGESRELGRLQRGADRSGDGDSERQAVASLIDALKARKMEVVVVLDNELTLVRGGEPAARGGGESASGHQLRNGASNPISR